MNPQEYSLNIRPGAGYAQTVKVSQGDVGRPLRFNLLDGAKALGIQTGTVITIHGTKPSGLGFTETCTLSGSAASVLTTLEMTQENGMFPAELVLTLGNEVIGTANFMMNVERSPHDENTIDGTYDVADSIFARMDSLEEGLDATNAEVEQIAASVPTVDATLTVSGAAADAKKTGDEITQLKSDFTDTSEVLLTAQTTFTRLQSMTYWTFGQEIVETTGGNGTNNKACRTAYISFAEPTAIEVDSADYILCAWVYSGQTISSALYSPTKAYVTGKTLLLPKAETSYFRIGVKRVDGAVLTTDYSDTSSDAYKILNAIKTYKLTSDTLNDGSAPINANAVKNNALTFNGFLDDGTDLNSVSDSGVYVLLSSRTYTNSPITVGFLHVYKIETVKMQVAYPLGSADTFLPTVYARYGSGSGSTITSTWRMISRGRKTAVKMACFGDSIMYGQNGNTSARVEEQYRIPSILAYNLNIETTNYGVGSQGYLGLIDETAYDNISSKDLTQFNAMVMCYGVNDGYRDLGSWDSTDETTIMGQFNKIITYVFGQNPSIRLIVVAPYNGRNVGSFPKYWYGERSHPDGYVSRQVLSDTLKQACEYYNIPYIEQKNSPINAYTIQTLIGTDGVHPSLDGYLQLGTWLSGEVGKLIG